MNEHENALRQQAWNYFGIVAGQRLTVLNSYIAISSVIASVQFAILLNTKLIGAGGFLGVLLVFLSYVFWKWDKRSSDMIKIAEDALKYFEDSAVGFDNNGREPHVAKIFSREEYLTAQKKKKKAMLFWRNYYTYRICLNLVFASFALAGIVGIVLNFIL